MTSKEDKLLKAFISTEIKKLPNKGFTAETIRKIEFLEAQKTLKVSPYLEPIFFIPLFIYSLFIVLCFILKLLTVVKVHLGFSVLFLETILLSPVSFSIILVFSILGLFDYYLKSEGTIKSTKSSKGYSTSF
tara:strand:+ start:4338 stop:4733 length:396 start_codon:yes stop_codon:yes gene_type:complete